MIVIPEDRTIIVDGEALTFDFDADQSIHAIQWYGEYGIIERRTGDPMRLDDPADIELWLDVWRAEKARRVVPPEPPRPLTQADYERAVQAHLDAAARGRGYDGILSASSYAATANPFQSESQSFLNWRAACWAHCYQALADVQAGTRSMPTIPDLLAELPALVLP
jgi:hypothetical protein